MRGWLGRIERRVLGASCPDTLGDEHADAAWARLDQDTRCEWWAAWAGTVRDSDPVPAEPWRAGLVAALIDHARTRRRLTWLAASVTLVLAVVLVSAGTLLPRDPSILVDTLPYLLLVALLGLWDESRRRAFAERCRRVAALPGDLEDTTGAPVGGLVGGLVDADGHHDESDHRPADRPLS